MEIGDRIRAKRKERGITQVELAKATGISQSSISDIEKLTNNPSSTTLRLIARALSCTVGELIGEQDQLVSEQQISIKEKRLLDIFRQLTEDAQDSLIDFADAMLAKASMRKNVSTPAMG